MRAILAGGGTGGHVIPALAIAQELRTRFDAQVQFIGTARGIETRLVPQAGFELKLVQVGALKSVSMATRIKTVFDLPRAVLTAARFLRDFRADVVVGVGGYASGPAMLAAAMENVPSVAFEPNVVPGLANRIAGTLASAACVQFEETCKYFRRCKVTGIPVRRDFFAARQPAPEPMGPCIPRTYSGRRPTLLVFGGSQGARAINRAMTEALPRFRDELPNVIIIHQTGERDYQDAQAAYLSVGVSAEVYPFIDDMPDAFARADLLICRSGASTAAEVMAAGKAAVFIPYPHATDDHQRRNAEALVRAKAALLLPESDLTPETLVEHVKSLLCEDRARLARMAEAARTMAHPNAAYEIAALAARLAGVAEPSAQQRSV
jgi:UDP-N-acetylglucosamine--N-acetylmuramyl-(pentapeptide) pyrophosphoryl-undecaprenol N-acetylglucosamine transferase